MHHDQSRQRRYNRIRNRIALFEPFFVLAVLAFIQLSGLSLAISRISESISQTWYIRTALYGLIFGSSYYLLTFWLGFIKGYTIEHRFGLSNQTLKNWIKDEVKKICISAVIYLIFIEFLYFLLIYRASGWWYLLAAGWIGVTVFMAKFVPIIVIPLFFKSEPLGDGELRKRLIALAERCGLKILDTFRLKISAKTKKANAALVGLGATRRVLLGDTLLENYSRDEIEVVIAHELGHHKLSHMGKSIILSAVSILAICYLLHIISPVIADISGVGSINSLVTFPSILLVISLAGLILTPLQNAISRKMERSADLFALKATTLKDAFISCMTKLSQQNLSDPAPNRFIEIMLYDHPPVSKRIRMAEDYK